MFLYWPCDPLCASCHERATFVWPTLYNIYIYIYICILCNSAIKTKYTCSVLKWCFYIFVWNIWFYMFLYFFLKYLIWYQFNIKRELFNISFVSKNSTLVLEHKFVYKRERCDKSILGKKRIKSISGKKYDIIFIFNV